MNFNCNSSNQKPQVSYPQQTYSANKYPVHTTDAALRNKWTAAR